MAAVRGRSSDLPVFAWGYRFANPRTAATCFCLATNVQDADAIDLKQLATTAMILLSDGCDLLNVLGWRLQPK